MFKIRTTHPVGHREFATREEAVRVAGLWGFGPRRVYLNTTHPKRGLRVVPSA
jgi:hypothetical protein